MPNLRETRGYLAYATRHMFINEQEFTLLYDVHKSTSPEFLQWNYERFDLDEKTNNECMAEFRFYSEGINELAEQMQLPDETAICNGLVGASVPALCLYLNCYDCPCRYRDLLCLFCKGDS